jgi:hypothetical protein
MPARWHTKKKGQEPHSSRGPQQSRMGLRFFRSSLGRSHGGILAALGLPSRSYLTTGRGGHSSLATLTYRAIFSKIAYGGLFLGATSFSPWERIWKTWAPPKCHFFMWLVAHKRCWTTDRLARRGLPHPECCPLCDQADESIDHLLVTCVFSRQFWFHMF